MVRLSSLQSLASATSFSALQTSIFRFYSTSTSRHNSSQSSSNQHIRSKSAALLFFGAPVVLTFSLGVWQTKRLYWKKNLIQDLKNRLYDQPLTSEDLYNLEDIEFRTVQLRGRFLHRFELLVGPRSAPKNLPPAVLQWGGSSGLQVVTPCQLESGQIILVNRGWIPHRLAEQTKRSKAAVSPLPFLSERPQLQSFDKDTNEGSENLVQFSAIVRNKQERNRFMPSNNPSENEWFYIHGPQMMQHCGFEDNKKDTKIVELCDPWPLNGWPFPRDVDKFLEFRTPPSTHVTYAVTWFCLSGALAVLLCLRIRKPVHFKM